jgi:hypothetical protein
LTLQDNMNVVVGCGPQTWMIPTQHLTVPVALCSPETHMARFCRSFDTSLVVSSAPDRSGSPYVTRSFVQLTGFVSTVFQRSPTTIHLTLRMLPTAQRTDIILMRIGCLLSPKFGSSLHTSHHQARGHTLRVPMDEAYA